MISISKIVATAELWELKSLKENLKDIT